MSKEARERLATKSVQFHLDHVMPTFDRLGSAIRAQAPASWKAGFLDQNFKHKRYRDRLGTNEKNVKKISIKDDLAYKYSALPENSIRVLTVLPGSGNSSIETTLTPHSIKELHEFDALSYTWGLAPPSQTITIDGKLLAVTLNLGNALRQMRQAENPRRLWIDAICINQMDMDERSYQVTLMREVYMAASLVVVWIGTETADTVPAFDLMRKLAEAKASPNLPQRPILPQDLAALNLPPSDDPSWESLDTIYWRPWYTRVWIVQEISLAKKAVVLCGSQSIGWAEFGDLAVFQSRHLMGRFTGVDPARLESLVRISNEINREVKVELGRLLFYTRSFLATNPRDHIYALLGLSELQIVPNYKAPVRDVLVEATSELLRAAGNIHLLTGVSDSFWSAVEGLPTWVPDWTTPVRAPELLTVLTNPYPRATGETTAQFSIAGDVLSMEGAVIDTVEDIASALHIVHNKGGIGAKLLGKATSQEILDMDKAKRLLSWERVALRLATYPTGDTVETVLHQTLTAGQRLGEPDYDTPDARSQWYAAFRSRWVQPFEKFKFEDMSSGTSDDNAAVAAGFDQALWNSCLGRRLFVTKKGYMGIAPSSTTRGDQVALFAGGVTPYIIRKVKTRFRFVGDCYVHGIMHGEALDASSFGTLDLV
ncbi:HET-domain-containing protein [Trichodelitschia bisporula]|uniref:HET-domain-containing protein n=1 Tax=Trichodelitschia bisporula TaxID=703511 RepID=A0A6G1I277_9PEZI|nr:HET-domain-containing protein [Trichodelitschia bisporula]